MINAFNAGDQRQGRRDRGLRRRQGRVRGADQASARAGASRSSSYNADGARAGAKARMAYIGQDLYVSGFEMGKRIVELVRAARSRSSSRRRAQLNIQPRIDGAHRRDQGSRASQSRPRRSRPSPDLHSELSMIDAYYLGPQEPEGHVRRRRRRHPGRRPGDPEVQARRARSRAAATTCCRDAPKLIQNGALQFTIDQQPYLQGFYPVMQLFLARSSPAGSWPRRTRTPACCS